MRHTKRKCPNIFINVNSFLTRVQNKDELKYEYPSGSFDISEKALIEVRDQRPPLSEFDPKIGKLFSSMHICLMQKAVRHCLALRDGDSAKRRILIKGMLLGRTTGATLCSLEVSLAEEVAVNLNFQVIRRTML